MVLFHFIFELVKILILAGIYGTIIWEIFTIIGHYKPNIWLNKSSKKKFRLWLLTVRFIYIGLFIFMFTYWGNHELGDSARIPAGYWKHIEQTDGTYAYLEDTNFDRGNQIDISVFTISTKFICGKTRVEFRAYPGEYLVYNLKNNDVVFKKNEIEYNTYANINKLPTSDKFKDFNFYYNQYWNGWRFWLLP